MIKKKNFTFWCPIDFQKAKDKEGKDIMRLAGIASTADKDSDGEFLDPTGFDLKPFLDMGTINWHHGTKDKPTSIIGEPHKAKIVKSGLYLEADLYPSSEMAKDVYTLAKTLEKDSKTRRLGFSIEGSVIERGSDDKTHPDYKIVKKASITGCAVTHAPKNPKTFAEIIKGHTGEEEEDDFEKGEDLKIVEGTKEEMLEKIFSYFPSIDLEKAEKVNLILNKIKTEMKTGKNIKDTDINKALTALGIDSSEENDLLEKGKKPSKKELFGDDEEEEEEKPKKKVTKAKKDDEEEEEEEKPMKKAKKKVDEEEEEEEEKPKKKPNFMKGKDEKFKKKNGDEGEVEKGENDEEEEEEEEEKPKKKEIKKGVDEETLGAPKKGSAFDRIEKAIEVSTEKNETLAKALGTMLKRSLDEGELLKAQLSEALETITETNEELKKANENIEALGGQSQGRKSTTSFREKEFEKAEKGKDEKNVIKKSDATARAKIVTLLDQMTFAKGEPNETFAKALTSYEATGRLDPATIMAIEKETGYKIV